MGFDTKLAGREMVQIGPRYAATELLTHKRLFQAALVTSDALMLVLAFTLAYWLRFRAGVTVSPYVIPPTDLYIRLVAMLVPFWLVFFSIVRLYDFQILLGGTSEYARAFNACTSGMMLVVLATFFLDEFVIARGWLIMSWLFACLLVCTSRLFLRRISYSLRRQGYFISRALIIGTNSEALALADQLCDSHSSGLAVQGMIGTGNLTEDAASRGALPLLGTIDQLPELIQQRDISELIIASTALTRDQLLQVFRSVITQPNVEMRLSSGLYEAITTDLSVTMMNSVPLMSFNRLRLDPIESVLKRALDLTLVLTASIVLLPIAIVLALLVRLDSPGPAFYRRRVLGVGGKQFDAFKFRTMAVNGDEILAQHPALLKELNTTRKLKNDPRITRVGRWLRATSLDELPQLLNVLIGQMSLVGPRMIAPDEAIEYGILSSNLLTVKPGITGLWQVSGRSDLSYEERVRLDMHYIRNYNIWLDLQILFVQTLPAVLKRDGAY